MNFDRFFKLISFAVVFCGFFALWVSGGAGLLVSGLFLAVFVAAWFADGSRWQISERVGTALMFVVVPLFYVGWQYRIIGFGATGAAIVSVLAKLILLLTAVKLFQKKGERDWLFLYLMSFFEVLLSAGISISPLFFVSIILYLLVTLCAIITFEIRKTSKQVHEKFTSKKKVSGKEKLKVENNLIIRLPSMAVILLFLIIVVAVPLFFLLPRVGGAGLGNNQGESSSMTGFSDSVRLGEIGQLKQNDAIVFRARLENIKQNNLNTTRWRGVALDSFDNRNWSKSNDTRIVILQESGGFINARTQNKESIVVQTVYLEPFDSQVLFALPRFLGVQEGSFQHISKDSNDGLYFSGKSYDRLIYKAYSDTSMPSAERLRTDKIDYSENFRNRYLQLPEKFDDRIKVFTAQITENRTNRYDKAKAVEQYLQNNFGYTLDLRVGGDEPLADFLFNVKEGHCEYFASAMAMMLRTQGIATRVVNGFQQGEYNETAEVFVVKQKDAHSWVEVYFPETNAWIPFDPTPFAGQTSAGNYGGTFGSLTKYLEALETYWIQYFVAFDNQEQRSLFSSVKSGFQDYQTKSSGWLNQIQDKISDWWREVRGDKGLQTSAMAILYAVGWLLGVVLGLFLIVWLYRKIIKLKILQNAIAWIKRKNETTIIEFYERMQKVLASKGLKRLSHQTPLEFAFELDMPEAVKITEKYNRVRFGEKNLSNEETEEIENWLEKLEKESVKSTGK